MGLNFHSTNPFHLLTHTKKIKVLTHFCKLLCQTSPKIIRVVNKEAAEGEGMTERLNWYLSLGKTDGKCEPGARQTFDFCKTHHTYL